MTPAIVGNRVILDGELTALVCDDAFLTVVTDGILPYLHAGYFGDGDAAHSMPEVGPSVIGSNMVANDLMCYR
ncbi:MAG: hypothetical protein BWY63_03578 [Chloroflexi bacterium ADurb.Bin360]|nr:MAG: hypothetical protein BWY63_03578 [Chloroflexi bacterium ADurb.Bin360]